MKENEVSTYIGHVCHVGVTTYSAPNGGMQGQAQASESVQGVPQWIKMIFYILVIKNLTWWAFTLGKYFDKTIIQFSIGYVESISMSWNTLDYFLFKKKTDLDIFLASRYMI